MHVNAKNNTPPPGGGSPNKKPRRKARRSNGTAHVFRSIHPPLRGSWDHSRGRGGRPGSPSLLSPGASCRGVSLRAAVRSHRHLPRRGSGGSGRSRTPTGSLQDLLQIKKPRRKARQYQRYKFPLFFSEKVLTIKYECGIIRAQELPATVSSLVWLKDNRTKVV